MTSTIVNPTLKPILSAIPKALRFQKHWVLWTGEYDPVSEKLRKFPVDPASISSKSLKKISPIDPSNWLTFDDAVAFSESLDSIGIGFAVRDACGFILIDIDDRPSWDQNKLSEILSLFYENGAYVEESPSGTGLRVICHGTLPDGHRTRRKSFPNVEVYTTNRFVTITGKALSGSLSDNDLSELVIELFPEILSLSPEERHTDVEPQEEKNSSNSDILDKVVDDILMRGLADAGRLQDYVVDGYSSRSTDKSGEDFHFFCLLSAYTRSPDQMEEIYRENAIGAQRGDKADRKDYLPRTIQRALEESPVIKYRTIDEAIENLNGDAAHDKNIVKEAAKLTAKMSALDRASAVKQLTDSSPFSASDVKKAVKAAREADNETNEDLEKILKGAAQRFIFITSLDRWYDRQAGVHISSKALDTSYAHELSEYGVTASREIARRSDKLIADELGWEPRPITDTDENPFIYYMGSVLANSWRGFFLKPKAGSVEPWLKLLAHLTEDESEQTAIIERLAFDVQYPHKKAQWGVIIHGVQGAGKDSLMMPIGRIFGSAMNTVGMKELKSAYDDAFVQSKIVVMSEMNMLKSDALEDIKRKMVDESTGMMILNPKSKGQVKHRNLWSMYGITNHDDAISMSPNERRFYVVTARTAMKTDQIAEYQDWLNNEGAEFLFQHLLSVDLSSFTPGELPSRTASFYEMVDNAKGDLETILTDLCDNSSPPFDRNDSLVSSTAVEEALIQYNQRYHGISRIKKWLRSNGYETIGDAVKLVGGKTKRKKRTHYALAESKLHRMTGTEKYELIEQYDNSKVTSDGKFS